MSSSPRKLFVGVPVALEVVRELGDVARRLRRECEELGLRVGWVTPARYHVTLKFIGWVRPEAIDAMADAVRAAVVGQRRFRFGARGLGAFPQPNKARVLWAGVEDEKERLAVLAGRIDAELARVGVEAERRPFHPHVTLGRVKAGPANVADLLERFSAHVFSDTWVDAVVLFESSTNSDGSECHRVAEAALDDAS